MKKIFERLQQIRAAVLGEYPFWGSLLLHLQIGLASCETAYTDMKRLVFDPSFVGRLNDEQVKVVMLHEVMHCALDHCSRARNHDHYMYNIACDIVVNSNLLYTMGYEEFQVDNENLMHLAPDGKEGRLYSAEEVYRMLMKQAQSGGGDSADEGGNSFIDRHDPWSGIRENSAVTYEWKEYIQEAEQYSQNDMLSQTVRDELDSYKDSKVDWVRQLHDFLHECLDKFDYSFTPSDRRYSDSDFIMPSFHEVRELKADNLWFCVDTSGSITDEELSILMGEIKQALIQFDGLSGKISFFDHTITRPVDFDSVDTLKKIRPVGGGGTIFHNIFLYMKEYMAQKLPEAVIIMTDGYAVFPEEKDSLGVPVLWILLDSNVTPPWGNVLRIRA